MRERGNLVFDLDGVVYVGDHVIPGAAEVFEAATAAGYRLLFATNNASRTTAWGAERISALTGHPVEEDQVLNSALAAATLLNGAGGERCLVVGGPGLHEAVQTRGGTIVDRWSDAEIVLAGFNRDVTYALLRDATLAIRAGARFIATNDDATFPAPNGLWPGAGATVSFLVTATDVKPVIAGKPHAPMRRLIRERLGAGRVWMIGDRPETDLAMAKAEGWISVLTLSGVTADADQVPEILRPDHVIPSIAGLLDLLALA